MTIPETEIIVKRGDTERVRQVVRPGEYVLGREPDCAIVVEADGVSRHHARLTINYDHALIEDLGSSNGTFVNEKPVVEPTRLWPNQKIRIGPGTTISLRRLKSDSGSDVSLAPTQAAVQRILPEEFLRDKKYDIGGVVAQGGMGAILNAREATTERTVAMKVMLDTLSPEDLVRFIAEAKVTAQLEHPNIVPIYELSVDENGQVFYTMKFVRGITLRAVLESLAVGDAETVKKFPLLQLLIIFQKVCDAVAFAHSRRVIHRDLKPENVMIGDYGEVLVMDWGLAKVLGQSEGAERRPADEPLRSIVRTVNDPASASATMAGTVLGTPQYMAPEQARGEIDSLDACADIYALGAILYHILSLRPPLRGDDAWEVVKRVAEGKIDPLTSPSKKRPLPESLTAVIRKAMALDKTARYSRVEQLQRDIAAYQTGFATSAEQAKLMKQIILLIKRHKGIFTTVFAAWLIITVLAVWFIVSIRASERKATRNAEIAEQNAKLAEANERKAVERGEATRHALAKAQLALAEGAFREEDGPAMQAALNGVPEDLRDSNWNYLLTRADTSLATIKTAMGTGSDSWSVAPHPKQPGIFAIGLRSATIALVNAVTGATLQKFEAGFSQKVIAIIPKIAFSPDGERIAVGRMDIGGQDNDGGIVIHSARDGSKLLEIAAPKSRSLEFDHDGQRLLQTCYYPEMLKMWDAATGQLLWTSKADNYVRAAFDPTGKFLAAYSDFEKFRILNPQDGSLVRPLPSTSDGIAVIAIHPDGIRMLTGDRKGSVRAWDVRDGRTLFEIRANNRSLTGLAFTQDGDRFVTLANEPGGRQSLQVWNLSGGKRLQTLLGGSGEAFGLAVHPLSGEVVASGLSTKSWNVKNAPVKWTLPAGICQEAKFWGEDDLLWAPENGPCDGLFDLSAATDKPLTPVWKSKLGFTANTTSGDGRFAALGHSITYAPSEIQFVRKSGRTAEEVRVLQTHRQLNFLRLNYTGDRLAVFHEGVIFDPTTGSELKRLYAKIPAEIHDAAWIGSTPRIVVLIAAHNNRGVPGSEEQVVLYDAATGQQLKMLTHPSAMDCLAVSPDGQTIAEAGADKMVRLRDAETLAVKKEFRAHDDGITALAFHPTQPILATGSADLSVKLWNLESGKQIEEMRGAVALTMRLNFSPGGKRLAAKAYDGHVLVWEPQSLNGKPETPR